MRHIEGARDVPWARQHLLDSMEPDVSTHDANQPSAHMQSQLKSAGLYWVTPPMTELALDASLDIPEWTIRAAQPSTSGILMWGGNALPEVLLPATALAVSPKAARPIGIFWTPTYYVPNEDVGDVSFFLLGKKLPNGSPVPVYMMWACTVPVDGPPVALPDANGQQQPEAAGVLALLGATWRLMMEPQVASKRDVSQARKDRASARKMGLSESDITVVDLRTIRHVDAATSEPSGRHLSVRHYVRGHWRQQWRPSTSTHEPRFIAPYIKGPSGAPLVVKERVTVWRR